jgi:hypothetical protein
MRTFAYACWALRSFRDHCQDMRGNDKTNLLWSDPILTRSSQYSEISPGCNYRVIAEQTVPRNSSVRISGHSASIKVKQRAHMCPWTSFWRVTWIRLTKCFKRKEAYCKKKRWMERQNGLNASVNHTSRQEGVILNLMMRLLCAEATARPWACAPLTSFLGAHRIPTGHFPCHKNSYMRRHTASQRQWTELREKWRRRIKTWCTLQHAPQKAIHKTSLLLPVAPCVVSTALCTLFLVVLGVLLVVLCVLW